MALDTNEFLEKFTRNGKEYPLNPVEDCLFLKPAFEEKERISSLMAQYGILLSSEKRQLSLRRHEKKILAATIRNKVELEIAGSGRKPTLDAISSDIEKDPTMVDKELLIIEAEYRVSYLEQCIWALKTKADNIKELLKPEMLNN